MGVSAAPCRSMVSKTLNVMQRCLWLWRCTDDSKELWSLEEDPAGGLEGTEGLEGFLVWKIL